MRAARMKLAISSVLLVVLGLAFVGLTSARSSSLNEWNEYKKQHGKVYATPDEDANRFSLFLKAKDEIEQHNKMFPSAHKLGLTKFSDWTRDEFKRIASSGTRHNARDQAQQDRQHEATAFLQQLFNQTEPVPDELDWRKIPNRVTSVKDFLTCSASWAFAAVGALEGQMAIRVPEKKFESLSAQQVVDCSGHCGGCDETFSSVYNALEDVRERDGIVTESEYPYFASLGRCSLNANSKFVMTTSGALQYRNKGEEVLKSLVAKFGPVAASVSSYSWRNYKSGVFKSATCQDDIDTSVLVVGYGNDKHNNSYWVLKNSWGTDWGEQGYIRLERGSGMCDIGSLVVMPKFSD